MYPTLDPSSFTVPLGLDAHRMAEQFRRHHSDPQIAKRVYLNTLAIYTVDFYLACLGFEATLSAGRSWNIAAQTLMDVADLFLPHYGRLECRPVLPDATQVYIPPEVWQERIGYLAVQLDASLRQATILGFLDQVTTDSIPLTQLHPLEDLVTHLQHVQASQAQPVDAIAHLSQWLQGIVETGWQAIGEFFTPQADPDQLAFDFRINRPPTLDRDELTAIITQRSKRLTLEIDSDTVPIVLLVGILPIASQEFEIWVQVSPGGNQPRLPERLELMVLDAEGEEVMQAQARRTEALQLQFQGELGEAFGLRLMLEGVQITEEFVI